MDNYAGLIFSIGIVNFFGFIFLALALSVGVILEGKKPFSLLGWGCVVFFIVFGFFTSTNSYDELRFAKEVDRTRVTILGEQKFNANVEIVYQNGKYKEMKLIEGTTALVLRK